MDSVVLDHGRMGTSVGYESQGRSSIPAQPRRRMHCKVGTDVDRLIG